MSFGLGNRNVTQGAPSLSFRHEWTAAEKHPTIQWIRSVGSIDTVSVVAAASALHYFSDNLDAFAT